MRDRIGQRANRYTGRNRPLSANARNAEPQRPLPPPPAAEPQQPQPAPPEAEPKPDGFTIGGFTFKVGGRIKLDIIRDFDPIGSEDSFDPRTIPVDGSEGTNSNLIAKETRLSLDMRGPVEGKELRMYVETDFYGSGSVLRLRQAYGSYGGLLAGQAWSTFVDDNNFPNTIDFESPMAFPSVRQAQLRWTQKLGANVSWSAAVEDNKSHDRATCVDSRQGGVPDAGPGHTRRLYGVRAATLSPPAFSAGRASVQTRASRTT